ncbi:unnamed protein product [Spodoptera exigua]|nr:unnamed protein product [Spodoptera exigua]
MYDCLYNIKSRHYSDKNIKNNAWQKGERRAAREFIAGGLEKARGVPRLREHSSEFSSSRGNPRTFCTERVAALRCPSPRFWCELSLTHKCILICAAKHFSTLSSMEYGVRICSNGSSLPDQKQTRISGVAFYARLIETVDHNKADAFSSGLGVKRNKVLLPRPKRLTRPLAVP